MFHEMERSCEDFFDFNRDQYWSEICQMTEEQLRAAQVAESRKLQSAYAGMGTSVGAAFFTHGLTLGLTAYQGRRHIVHSKKIELIKHRMQAMGWREHHTDFRDVLVGVGPALVAEAFLPASSAAFGAVAAHHATDVTISQQAALATQQHAAQIAATQTAGTVATHASLNTVSSFAGQGHTFVDSILQGAASEVFTTTHGLVGHPSPLYFSPLPANHIAAATQALGETAGQSLVSMGASSATQYVTGYGLEYGMKGRKG